MNFALPIRTFALYPLVLAGLALAVGCGRTISPSAQWGEVVTQISTYPALSEGHYQGQIAVSNLVAFGDHGLGTFDGLDGEMVLHEGTVYRVGVDGRAVAAPLAATVPFAQVTWFTPDAMYDVMAIDQKLFRTTMAWKQPDIGHMQAIRVSGIFSEVRVRSVPRQSEPYPSLDSVVADQQVEHTLRNVRGTLIGFFTPAAVGSVAPGGYHLHFLTNDRSAGGHVLDFKLTAGRIEVDDSPELRTLLPTLPPPSDEPPVGKPR
ncbi:MAG: acetolactate decarboxylase [Kiritimatiellae bacterium]|nr:acetolactate decarboxylase [Kiritimatiellia bacterium]